MYLAEVNIITVIIAALINIALGGLWYSPALFGKDWMQLTGMSEERIKATNMTVAYLGAFITSLITAFVLAHLLHLMGIHTLVGCLTIGFWIWLGFFATGQLGGVLWERKPFKL